MSTPIYIRWGLRADIPAWLACGTSWTADDFLTALRFRNCISMSVETSTGVVGVMVYELHRRHIKLLNFTVHPDHRRRGIGSALFGKLVYKIISHRRACLTATVPDDTLDLHLFLASQRCRAIRCTPDGILFLYRPTDQERVAHGFYPATADSEI